MMKAACSGFRPAKPSMRDDGSKFPSTFAATGRRPGLRPKRPDGLVFYPEDIVFHHSYYVNYVRDSVAPLASRSGPAQLGRGLPRHASPSMEERPCGWSRQALRGHGSFAIDQAALCKPSSVDNASGRRGSAWRKTTRQRAGCITEFTVPSVRSPDYTKLSPPIRPTITTYRRRNRQIRSFLRTSQIEMKCSVFPTRTYMYKI